MKNKNITLIGVAGGSCSGKSWLCERTRCLLPQSLCEVISLDSYYKDLSSMSETEREGNNFDAPDALDRDLLESQLYALTKGNTINVPAYNFSNHTRSLKTRRIEPLGKIILVEGLFSFYWKSIRQLFVKKFFIDFDDDERFSRRLKRDTKERGRDIKSITRQYREIVSPMYELFIEPTRKYADFCIKGNLKDREIQEFFLKKITRI